MTWQFYFTPFFNQVSPLLQTRLPNMTIENLALLLHHYYELEAYRHVAFLGELADEIINRPRRSSVDPKAFAWACEVGGINLPYRFQLNSEK